MTAQIFDLEHELDSHSAEVIDIYVDRDNLRAKLGNVQIESAVVMIVHNVASTFSDVLREHNAAQVASFDCDRDALRFQLREAVARLNVVLDDMDA